MLKNFLLILIILLSLFFVSFPIIKRIIFKKFHNNIYLKNLENISFRNDFQLINDIDLSKYTNKDLKISHILFGNKFVYIIDEFYYSGVVKGNSEDYAFMNIKKGNVKYIDNFFHIGLDKIKNASNHLKIDNSIIVYISLINDCCDLRTKSQNDKCYIVKNYKLKHLINKLEKSNVRNLNKDEVKKIVEEIKYKNE